MTTIYLIRHGQAEGNLYRRCHSWHNGLLTLRGREQVQACLLYTSDAADDRR